ncbi:MAG: ring-cleaving dioxygenase [Gemmatimonadaceae bacterium]|nr:ring-cleaving dioxygenase [Gemmatimonadaceae bacterium]
MDALIRGLHHVTATVTDAQADLDFYVGLLGQRLVKKTVNFDNPGVYHFYYGNEAGEPGTIMTTFPYAGMGVRVGTKGAGQVETTSFSVPAAAMDFWRARLRTAGVPFTDAPTPFGEPSLRFDDPSGLRIRLVGVAADDRTPWTRPDIPAGQAIRGIHSVAMPVRLPAASVTLLTGMMDAVKADEAAGIERFGIGGAARPGAIVELVHAADTAPGVNGLGTVHHVAFAVATPEDQRRMQRELRAMGLQVTDVMDRQYFTSIYFREPNGVLYEIATMPPGFAIDEPLATLGRDLKLPPWEETRRALIEQHLPPVTY